MEDYKIINKVQNDTRRTLFYEYQKLRNSKVSYGSFLKSYESYIKALNKLESIQEGMDKKYGLFTLFLREKCPDA